MTELALRPAAVEALELAAPLASPRRNAFGAMTHRPALLVRLVDADGAEGWGEAFCNWPRGAAAHRARLLREVLAPLALSARWEGPAALWEGLTARTRLVALQSGEPGPFAQAAAGLEMAAWDLCARRAGRPLHALLGPGRAPVPVYASALTAGAVARLVPPLSGAGWRGFKLKVGFGARADAAALRALREAAGPEAALMVDANQAWDAEAAVAAGRVLAAEDPLFLEEPIPADAPPADWARVAGGQPIPLAVGENLRDLPAFEAAAGWAAWLQPDAAKWGGLGGLGAVAALARGRGVGLAPHWLGSGLGLLATLHAAVAHGADWLEVDATENPLRDALCGDAFSVEAGAARPPATSGLGPLPDRHALAAFGP